MHKKSIKKVRKVEFSQSYEFDTHDENGNKKNDLTVDQWKDIVRKKVFSVDSEYTWLIFHDKDEKEVISDSNEVTIEKIGIHYHGIFLFKNPRSINSVAKEIGTEQVYKLEDYVSFLRYLTHTSEAAISEKKYRYEIDELYLKENNLFISNNDKRKIYTSHIANKSKKSDKVNKFTDMIISNILDGKIKDHQINEMYRNQFSRDKADRYYIDNLNRFEKAFKKFEDEYYRKKRKEGRKLVTVYIYGQSSSGKTTIGGILCKKQSKYNAGDDSDVFKVSSQSNGLTKDYFQNYKGEYSTFFDEFMPEHTFSFSEFNKVFNPNSVEIVASRNKNKIWYSEFCAMSKSRNVFDMVESLCLKASFEERKDMENLRKQIMRRIPVVLEVLSNKIIVSVFDEQTNSYKLYKSYKNVSIRDSDKNKINKCLEEINQLIQTKRKQIYSVDDFII